MPTIRRVQPSDLFHLNLCNLDPYTENYDLNFYLTYLMRWPSLFQCIEEHGQIVGYIIGKVEESPSHLLNTEHYLPWHGHVTALSIAPQYRRLGYGKLLTESLEKACNQQNAWFVDLFVRKSNRNAIKMYESMGYSTFRTVVKYYSDDPTGISKNGEDALDMRKPLDRDVDRQHVRENGEDFKVDPEDVF
ncbi:N-terminal acetyltransferase B complex catalytic subunit naa20 [Cladophialophora carrionii]|uniref:N-terminal acetyltransferase B complex catalytic subunit naa20 n=1 Tax=Cladophialophora carrionii TaxID=86049 RepID=A0A1C1CK35_9EURO|nr:N-terminal acetyltransferase B complex catalytic subunit naa20 [Cladophialophora carrionii]